MSPVAEKELLITNKAGLHARAAALLVQCAGKFRSQILVSRDGESVNGKSIMGVMMLAAIQGTRISVRAEGEDAEQAIAEITALVEGKFGEE